MNIKMEVTKRLHDMGMPAHLQGFDFLREAVMLAAGEPDYLRALTGKLYPKVAETFSTTASRAERAMRHAIEVAFDRGDLEKLHDLFGFTVRADKGRPTTGEFIALVADHLRLEMEAGTCRS